MDKRRKLIPAISEAIEKNFDEGDWKKLSYEVEKEELIANHPRLLRSLQWGDSDYEGCVFKVVEHIYDFDDENIDKLLNNTIINNWLKSNKEDIYTEFCDKKYISPFKPKKEKPSEVVERALKDAELLLAKSGAVSAIDRAHTALHGYLKSICQEYSISVGNDPSITDLYKAIRADVPAIRDLGSRSEDLNKMLRSLMSVLDALNPIRNKASVAHPNDNLLGKEEADFTINIIRSVLHYLDSKLP